MYAPGFCSESWCYVSEECVEFDDVEESTVIDGAFYSYEACGGDSDALSPAEAEAAAAAAEADRIAAEEEADRIAAEEEADRIAA